MRKATRRQWWLWSTGVIVLLLLTIGIASFAFPGLLQSGDSSFYQSNLVRAVLGLVGLVLLFIAYVIHQQLQIHRYHVDVDALILKVAERTEQAYKIAGRDVVTDLYNRHLGEERLLEEMARSRRHGRPLTVVRLDVNGLAEISEAFGQISEDHTIRYFAKCLQKAVRNCDIPVRLGPSEFLVLLPDCKEAETVLKRLNTISAELGERLSLQSVVASTIYVAGEPSEALLLRAERGLHANQEDARRASAVSVHARTETPPNGKNQSDGEDATLNALSPRERQVLGLVALGKSSKEVADELGIGVRTVESYRAGLMTRLNIHSVAELTQYAIRHKIINIGGARKG